MRTVAQNVGRILPGQRQYGPEHGGGAGSAVVEDVTSQEPNGSDGKDAEQSRHDSSGDGPRTRVSSGKESPENTVGPEYTRREAWMLVFGDEHAPGLGLEPFGDANEPRAISRDDGGSNYNYTLGNERQKTSSKQPAVGETRRRTSGFFARTRCVAG
jgi:hypothetical protein